MGYGDSFVSTKLYVRWSRLSSAQPVPARGVRRSPGTRSDVALASQQGESLGRARVRPEPPPHESALAPCTATREVLGKTKASTRAQDTLRSIRAGPVPEVRVLLFCLRSAKPPFLRAGSAW